jgi:hypothetical protein
MLSSLLLGWRFWAWAIQFREWLVVRPPEQGMKRGCIWRIWHIWWDCRVLRTSSLATILFPSGFAWSSTFGRHDVRCSRDEEKRDGKQILVRQRWKKQRQRVERAEGESAPNKESFKCDRHFSNGRSWRWSCRRWRWSWKWSVEVLAWEPHLTTLHCSVGLLSTQYCDTSNNNI